MTMTQSINPATQAKLEALKAEIAQATNEPAPAPLAAEQLEAQKKKLAAVVTRVLADDAELLERLADA